MKAVLLCAIALGAVSTAQAQVRVVDPWVRSTVAGQTVAGAFMKLESPVAESLVGASSPAAARVELHRTIMEGTVAKMRPVARIDLAPGKPVELKPGGYHIMLVDIAKPLARATRCRCASSSSVPESRGRPSTSRRSSRTSWRP